MRKKDSTEKSNAAAAEMLPEYDLSGMKLERGKYYQAMQHGYTRRIREADGSITEEFIQPHVKTISLDPDVQVYFPTSQAVNEALRALIKVIEQTPRQAKAPPKRRAKKAA